MAAVAEIVTIEAMADARLDSWARWANGHGLGVAWPRQTLLARIMEQGPSGASQHGRPPISMPDEVAEVDRIVAKLSGLMRGVITVHYLTHAPSEVKARSLRISRAQFWRLLKRAQRQVFSSLQ